MTVKNIVNGEAVDSPISRKASGWTLPTTTDEQLSLAMKGIHRNLATRCSEDIRILCALGREADWITRDHLLEIVDKTGSPIQHLQSSVDKINGWLASLDRYVASIGEVRERGGIQIADRLFTGGVRTAMILAGDTVEVAPFGLAHLIVAGGNGIVKPSSAEPLSAFLFLKAALHKGLTCRPSLLYFDSGSAADRATVQSIVGRAQQSVVFGEDHTIASVYGGLPFQAAHKALPYWSGRSGAIVCADADIELAARRLVRGATEDRGNLCLSTKKVFVARSVAADLEYALLTRAKELRYGDPRDDRTSVGVLSTDARMQVERAVVGSEVLHSDGLVIARCGRRSALLREEIGYPVLGVCPFEESEDPVQLANASVETTPTGRALVMAVFTRSPQLFEELARGLAAHKVVVNDSTTDFDCFHAHQGFHLFVELMRPKAIVG
jgi:hypothetical protein